MRQEESNEVDKKDPDRVETALSRSFSKSETHLVRLKSRTWDAMRIQAVVYSEFSSDYSFMVYCCNGVIVEIKQC